MDIPEVNQVSNSHAAQEADLLGLEGLRHQLDVLVDASETLKAHLEAQRDQATRRGDTHAARALERGVLQITRVRNDIRCACQQLDASQLVAA